MVASGQVWPSMGMGVEKAILAQRESAPVRRIELQKSPERFAEPTPLGLIGLAIGCASLLPVAFGVKLGPAGLETAAVFCLLFGGGCQLLAGLMNYANKNLLGGTVFTAFAFNWALNAWALWSLSRGVVPDHATVLATEAASLLLFVPLTYAFGFHSSLLFAFLLDIDVLYALKLLRGYGHVSGLELPIAVTTLLLGAIALWIALAQLVNPVVKKPLFRVPGPLFKAPAGPTFDWSLRRTLFEKLYAHWQKNGFEPLGSSALEAELGSVLGGRALGPELEYLAERGAVAVSDDGGAVRITATGIDLHEQLVLGKYG